MKLDINIQLWRVAEYNTSTVSYRHQLIKSSNTYLFMPC